MTVYVNGEPATLPARATLAEVVDGLGVEGGRGVAIAVNAEVVPRSAWAEFELPDQARVEIVNAVQGG